MGNKEKKAERLKELLTDDRHKHANYQLLPSELDLFLKTNELISKPHFEEERLAYFFKHLCPANKLVLDIGGNTGYFSFEFLKRGATCVDCYEGGKAHAEFLSLASDLIGLNDRFNVHKKYFTFKDENIRNYDIILLLNVLHHVGDDYGNASVTRQKAKLQIIKHLNYLAQKTNFLIFQLGFNWKGDTKQCLFEHGTKSEMIQFIKDGIKGFWEIIEIGVAEKKDGVVTYEPLNVFNVKRNDTLGEFLNRPIFILKSCLQRG